MFCIPIMAQNTEEALDKIVRAGPHGDVLEIRLDVMESFDLHRIIRSSPKPILVTYRSRREGGGGRADADAQACFLMEGVREGADFVDVELSLPQKYREKILDGRGKTRIVLSAHNPAGTPSAQELEATFRDCMGAGADVVKIVTMAKGWADNLRVLGLIPRAQDLGVKIIAFCMGPTGRISRVLSHLMGGHLTFTSLERGQESASGQIPIFEMKEILAHFSRDD